MISLTFALNKKLHHQNLNEYYINNILILKNILYYGAQYQVEFILRKLLIIVFTFFVHNIYADVSHSKNDNISIVNLNIKQFNEVIQKFESVDEEIEFFRSMGGDFIFYSNFLEKLKEFGRDEVFQNKHSVDDHSSYFFELEYLKIIRMFGSVHIDELRNEIKLYKMKLNSYNLKNEYINELLYFTDVPSFQYTNEARKLSYYSPFLSKRYSLLVSGLSLNSKKIENSYWIDRYGFGLCIVSQLNNCTFNIYSYLKKNKNSVLISKFNDIICNIKIGANLKLIIINRC